MPRSRSHRAEATRATPARSPVSVPTAPAAEEDFPVVAIGASAGGLDACRKLLRALPAGTGMAFVVVQHLDPNHESLMVDLLAGDTSMTVRQAAEGMPVAREHLYVIPPGSYLTVGGGRLHLAQPQVRHGARLPFDHLLASLATDYGTRAVGVILSGTGADGSLGLQAVRERHGLVIVQDPEEAGYDGMPRNAILTGAVDLVLPIARIPDALAAYQRRMSPTWMRTGLEAPAREQASLAAIVDLLRAKTGHDFTLYKPGTLQRRIERRMGMAGIAAADAAGYIDLLRGDVGERDLLATDLLINVTSFFRDAKVFDLLAKQIIPELVHRRSADHPLRIWIAGCSTGEETYSLVMLFREEITASNLNVKLQVFASDVDPDAVTAARDGLYPEAISAEVSPTRLSRFFAKEEHGYRVSPELRSVVVFTVQDVLADPPFSRLDFISCRNLLIYLRPEAQARIISLFHFALREGGILLLGSSETLGSAESRFEVISKPERLYRHIGRARAGEFSLLTAPGLGVRALARAEPGRMPSREAVLAELCRRLVSETYAPAAVLLNRSYECLFTLGPIDRYLRVAAGAPTHDVLAMARHGLRTKIRAAIQQAVQANARVVMAGGRAGPDGDAGRFSIAVHPVQSEGEDLLLVCFVDEPAREARSGRRLAPGDRRQIAELEQELAATRVELQGAIHNLEAASEEQRVVNEEALSVNEEFQSTNEELLTSKEELQSLNEELTALNTQLQETLERQRTTSNDLQNILYSTDVATLFLDADLHIRFFTPATRSLFSVIPTDIGRPLGDLTSLAVDGALLSDARAVLRGDPPIEREVETQAGIWYIRRIQPYRTQDNGVGGVVITFADVTERKRVADALQIAKQQAELANVAKSRFLAAASHDLRQPLQTLALVQGLLAQIVQGERAQQLVGRFDETLGAIAGMLNTLLDINQLEVGAVQPDMVAFPVNELLDRLLGEFTYHAQARRLALRLVRSGLAIRSDPRLLGQMLRNLLANAVKYTERGKVLLGCRRHGDRVSIEIWDTGIGIPAADLETIFEEYHQLDNPARTRTRGLGLGLAIVQRLGTLLGHRVQVRSHPGKGSVFAVEVMLAAAAAVPASTALPSHRAENGDNGPRRAGAILVIEDDPEVRDLLDLLLRDEGHRVASAPDGAAALELVRRGTARPDLILADYNLPGGMDGLQVAARLRLHLNQQVPVVILTGDISTGTLRDIARDACVQLYKPVKSVELVDTIRRLLPVAPAASAASPGPPVIFVVDDDSQVRAGLREVLETAGEVVEDYASAEAFLAAYRPGRAACLLIDAYLPGMSGLHLLYTLRETGHALPAIMITGSSDVSMAVQAMKAGALDFIEKPVGRRALLAGVQRALEHAQDASKAIAWREEAAAHVAGLTSRQRQIMELVLAGHPSKNIAADLGISQRTVENHRAEIMKRTGTKSLPALARLALAAAAP
ncbi:MAG TPA: chemotaxis protein CheB [Acetobacteraceae bacterium]|nr:chemotaxis protein CheB [Acetobacteraceae bacterium]